MRGMREAIKPGADALAVGPHKSEQRAETFWDEPLQHNHNFIDPCIWRFSKFIKPFLSKGQKVSYSVTEAGNHFSIHWFLSSMLTCIRY